MGHVLFQDTRQIVSLHRGRSGLDAKLFKLLLQFGVQAAPRAHEKVSGGLVYL